MRAIPILFSLLLIAAMGCGETAVTEKTITPIELDEVDAAGLESVLAANSVTLVDFTAVW